MSQDDDLAEATVHVETTPAPPALSSWSPEVAELRLVAERLGHVTQLLGVLSHNPYTPPTLPRPVTARERAWLRMNLSRHRRLAAQLIRPAEVDSQ